MNNKFLFRKQQAGFDHVLVSIVFVVIFALLGVSYVVFTHAATPPSSQTRGSSSGSTNSFNFGYDLAFVEPDWYKTNAQADTAGLSVLAKTPGTIVDQTMYGEGAMVNPEPSEGDYSASDLTYPDTNANHTLGSRITMITTAGDTPVITLFGAPSWMYGCATMAKGSGATGDCSSCYNSNGSTSACTKSPCEASSWNSNTYNPPCPAYYEDYAELAAHIAVAFPRVKYFIVWNEFHGFTANGSVEAANYTAMYNDVYKAIKKVRPDALVGGPYAPMASLPITSQKCTTYTLCDTTWGWIPQYIVNGFDYWLSNKVGADFVAIDGATEIATANDGHGNNTAGSSPLAASQKYAAVDDWIKSKTNLPIWWMESHLQPCNSSNGSNCDPDTACDSNTCWTDDQAAASRIATLALMNASGAKVGLWWQPGEEPGWQDEGLWTPTFSSNGGQPTTLDSYLNQSASILRQHLTLVGGQQNGVLVATTGSKVLVVNTLASKATASISGKNISLSPGQLLIENQ